MRFFPRNGFFGSSEKSFFRSSEKNEKNRAKFGQDPGRSRSDPARIDLYRAVFPKTVFPRREDSPFGEFLRKPSVMEVRFRGNLLFAEKFPCRRVLFGGKTGKMRKNRGQDRHRSCSDRPLPRRFSENKAPDGIRSQDPDRTIERENSFPRSESEDRKIRIKRS